MQRFTLIQSKEVNFIKRVYNSKFFRRSAATEKDRTVNKSV
jgi:hypothetical protein